MPLRLVDRIYIAWQRAAKRIGFMDPDEPGVRYLLGPDGPWLILDRDPHRGWPALKVRMPPASRPIHAVHGICTRGAIWECDASSEVAAAFLGRELDRQGIGFDRRDRRRYVMLDAVQARLKVSARDNGSLVGIMQKRSGQSVDAPIDFKNRAVVQ